jgi:hypothetical protein
MTRWFNTAGPCMPGDHYMIAPLERLPEARGLIEEKNYFVVHAPRQTGKTTTLMALARQLTAEGRFAALHFSCEVGEAYDDNIAAAERAVIRSLVDSAQVFLPAELRPPPLTLEGEEGLVGALLGAWSRRCPRPIVLFFDEIDALRGKSLVSVLRQLRRGASMRPEGGFPWSIILCGLRDVRDYKAASGGDPNRLGTSSPFNIKVESLRLGNFTPDEVRSLYAQHTAETGQAFTEEALAAAFDLTGGQPWLVNALAREIISKMRVPKEVTITAAHMDEAKEHLILERQTHLDSLTHKLREPRVRRVIEPLIAGRSFADDPYDDDLAYVRDLGLVAPKRPLRIANPIYREVIVRVLGSVLEENVTADPARFVLPDGRLAFKRMLRSFCRFWRANGEVLVHAVPYAEVAPQIVLMAYMQAIVNGGGFIDREYGVGRGRIDVLLRFPYRKADGTRGVQRRALELKVWRQGRPDPLKKGLRQLDRYLARVGLRRGTLVIFDARRKLAGKKPRFEEATTRSGRNVRVLRA